MSTAAQSVSVLMLVCAAPMVGLGTYAYLNLEKPGALGFLLCQVGAIGWSVQLALLAWPTQLMPVHLNTGARMGFQFLVMFGWLLLVWEYSRGEQIRPRRSVVAALLIVPLLTLVLAVTNPWHHLVLAADSPANPAGISEFEIGPWYLFFIIFAVLVIVPPAGLLFDDLLSAHGTHRNQILLLLAGWGIGFPGALHTYAFRNIDAVPLYVDLTPLAFSISAVLWGLALFRYHLFGLVPVSRRKTVETMADPVVAVDATGTVVDANPAARQLFDTEEDADVAGASLESFCGDFQELLSVVDVDGIHNRDITLDTDAGARHFSLDIRPIAQGPSASGSVLVFREVTQLRQRERELDLLKQIYSRVLRHNIRNQLTVLKGQTYNIEDRDESGAFAEQTAVIRATADRLLEHSEKATDLREIIDSRAAATTGDLATLVRTELSSIQDEYRTVSTEVEIREDVAVRAHPDINRAIREVLHNAVTHYPGERDDLRLRVAVTEDEHAGVVTVEDSGHGISDTEIATLEAGEETALQHGSGIGLWMVRLLVDKSGGELSIDGETDLGGSRVRIALPLADGVADRQ